jgi:hypothetical protein
VPHLITEETDKVTEWLTSDYLATVDLWHKSNRKSRKLMLNMSSDGSYFAQLFLGRIKLELSESERNVAEKTHI